MEFDLLLNELQDKTNLKKDHIQSLVDRKYSEMKDLITKEGAVYLIAKEFNVDLPEETRRFTIKN